MRSKMLPLAMMLAVVLVAPSCASRAVTSLTFPPVADLKVDAEPQYPVAALDPCPATRAEPCAAEQAERTWWTEMLVFGRTHRDRVKRICLWAKDLKAPLPAGYCDGS